MLYWDEPLTPTLGEGRRPYTPRTPSYNAARTSSPTHGACPDEQVKEPQSVLSEKHGKSGDRRQTERHVGPTELASLGTAPFSECHRAPGDHSEGERTSS